MKPLTLEALEVLDAIDRKGSFASAAASLYKVQSKVSYTVRKLEEDLGVELFRKEGRKSVLTPAGQTLLEQGRALLDATDRIVEQTRQVANGWESQLSIAMDGVIPLEMLTPHLEALFDRRPNIEIRLYQEALGGTWEALLNDRANLIVGAIEPPYPTPGIERKVFLNTEWGFFVAHNHPLVERSKQKKKPLTAKETANYRAAVVRDSATHLPSQSANIFEKQVHIQVSTMSEKIEVQKSGLAVGFLPIHLAQSAVDNKELVQLSHEADQETSVPLYIAWRKSDKGKALKWLKQELLARDLSGN